MKCLKEPLARRANSEDGSSGDIREGRYKSIAVLDEASLLATVAYIDLNPLAAELRRLPKAQATPRFVSGWTTASSTERFIGCAMTSQRLHTIRRKRPVCGCCPWPMIGHTVATALA